MLFVIDSIRGSRSDDSLGLFGDRGVHRCTLSVSMRMTTLLRKRVSGGMVAVLYTVFK